MFNPGFKTLVYREYYRFMRLARQTVLPPIMTTALYIAVFGYSIGSRIPQIHGNTYMEFIIPGLIMMTIVNNAYANSSSSIFMCKMEKSIENFLILPLHPFELVSAFVIGGVLRGLTVGLVVSAMAWLLTFLVPPLPIMTGLLMVLVSILFSCVGIINAQLARTWDQLSVFSNFILTPLIYLGGVFYSADMLPGWARVVTHFNPLFYIISGFRYTVLGVSDIPFAVSFGAMVGMTGCVFFATVIVFRGRKNLVL